jgi:hypothetical protein
MDHSGGSGSPAMDNSGRSDSSPWTTVEDLVPRCRPHCRIWLPALDHSGESYSRLGITADDLVFLYGSQRRIWFPTLDHSEGSGSHYEPKWMIWLHSLDHSGESCSQLWTTAEDLVPLYGPQCGIRIWFPAMNHDGGSGSLL